jgi:hypothetical protein
MKIAYFLAYISFDFHLIYSLHPKKDAIPIYLDFDQIHTKKYYVWYLIIITRFTMKYIFIPI